MIVALVVSLLALALAAAAWFKPTHSESASGPQYSEQQVADAKKNLCDAYDTMYRAVERAGTTTSEDPDQRYMIAINTRLAFSTAADYLVAELVQNPAAPPNLQDAFRGSARSYQKMVLAQLSDASKDKLDDVYADIDKHHDEVKTFCK